MSVEVFYWTPANTSRLPARRARVRNNFGDALTPLLVRRIVDDVGVAADQGSGRLISVGSVLHFSNPGDVVWGSGINGKVLEAGGAPDLDVRAVRGPLTRDFLVNLGTAVPEVYGDPGLLWSRYFPKDGYPRPARRTPTVIIPNLNDFSRRHLVDRRVVSPYDDVHEVAARIAWADMVVGSSLHAIVLAESYGVAARLVRSRAEPRFKYDDYYYGSGRRPPEVARSAAEAIAMGGATPPQWDADRLLAAFPADLWNRQP